MIYDKLLKLPGLIVMLVDEAHPSSRQGCCLR